MPKRDNGAATSSYILASLELHESGKADALTDNELMQAVAVANAKEAFLRVWSHAPRWDANGPAQFRTWLQRIVTNLAIDFNRKPKPLPIEVAGDPPDITKNAEVSLEEDEEARQVHKALKQLPTRQRAAVALYYFEEMTAVQAAEVLGLSAGATEALLVRARKSLRNLLTATDETGKNFP